MKTVAPTARAKDRLLPIVVVEDEETVLSFLENSLKASGYQNVQTCSDQASALQRVSDVPEGPVALIIDVALKSDNGIELATRLLHERPGARVLLISGFIDEMVLPTGATEEKRVAFLPKPFNFRQFSEQFDRLLAHSI